MILLKDQKYLISEIEERDESPECLLTNPYLIDELSYWEYSNVDYKNIHNPDALFIGTKQEQEMNREGELLTVTESNYVLLEKFPKYTNQTQVYLRAEDILSLADPTHSMVEYYKKIVG